MKFTLSRRVAAEFLGTGFLVSAVIGSGIMAERLSGGNSAIALLANTIATGAALATLILTFRPISGAHFNPVVSMAEAFRGGIRPNESALYSAVQICGGIAGAASANVMFAMPAFSISHHARTGPPQWLSEFVATFGLLLVIRICARFTPDWLPFAVAAYIVAAYWFTASTSFANPAVTIARSLSDTFAGIRPADVPAFLAAQLAGGFSAVAIADWLSFRSMCKRPALLPAPCWPRANPALNVPLSDAILAACRKSHPRQLSTFANCEKRTKMSSRSMA